MTKRLVVIACGWFLSLVPSCGPNRSCSIQPNEDFEGNGVLVWDNLYVEDGFTPVSFFPVCQLDTANLLQSLQHGGNGIGFSVDYWKLRDAIRHRSLVLTSAHPDVKRQKVYVTSVRLAFRGRARNPGRGPWRSAPYGLKTEEVRLKRAVFDVSDLDVTKLQGI